MTTTCASRYIRNEVLDLTDPIQQHIAENLGVISYRLARKTIHSLPVTCVVEFNHHNQQIKSTRPKYYGHIYGQFTVANITPP